MDKPLIEVKGLKQYFPTPKGFLKAVNGLSFQISKGSFHALVGESGSGKSTVARAILRLLKPTEGEILYDGIHLEKASRGELMPFRRKMQMIFQDPYASLNPRHTVQQAIQDVLNFHGVKADVKELFRQVGIPEDAGSRYPHEFSGGQQQRICIARALALQPELLICDEAVSALDVSVQAQIINLLLELKRTLNLTLLFIAHDLNLVEEVSDYVTVMYLGKEMESGRAKEVFQNPKHPYTRSLLASVPCRIPADKGKMAVLKGEIPSPVNPPSGCPFRTRCPFAEERCALEPPLQKIGDSHRYFCILR